MSRIISKTFCTKIGQIDTELSIYFDDLRKQGVSCDVLWVNMSYDNTGRKIIKSYTLNLEN